MPSLDQVLTDALSLNTAERAAIAELLLESLEPASLEDDVESVWANEVNARLKAVEAGRAALRSWEDVLQEARKRLAEVRVE